LGGELKPCYPVTNAADQRLELMHVCAARILLVTIFASASCLADSPGRRLPTLGLYVGGETGSDVLEIIIPKLSQLNFSEALPRAMSGEHLPVAIFRDADGDELQAVIGTGCVLLEFNGAEISPGTDPNDVVGRFNAIHDTLEQYFSELPQPHPRILSEVPTPAGCPTEF
jgi:hypothetical protein